MCVSGYIFVAADVCRVLGLSNPSMAVDGLDDDEQSKYCLGSGGSDRFIINESGMYSLIFRSRKPEAKKFRTIDHLAPLQIATPVKLKKYQLDIIFSVDRWV